MFEMLTATCHKHQEKLAFIYRIGDEEFRVSYLKLLEDVMLLARSFKARGISSGCKVVILSDNRYAWIVTDLALMSLGAVSVPRGADTPTMELEFIIKDSGADFLVMESESLLDIHEHFIKECRQLKAVFVIEALAIHTLFGQVYSYNDLLADRSYAREDAAAFLENGRKIQGNTVLTIIYTSGTTGQPKGVVLTHANIMHNVLVIPDLIKLTAADRWLSILPSWHVFERMVEYVALAGGSNTVYSKVKTFGSDLEHYKPSMVASVPRVWESLYSRVQAGVKKKGKTARRIFSLLVSVSAAYRKNYRIVKNRLPEFEQDRRIRKNLGRLWAMVKIIMLFLPYLLAVKKLALVKKRFGGRLRLAVSGGGSLAAYLEEWLDAVGIRIINAYGMTECSPAIAGRVLNCRIYGTLGPALPETSLRIVDEEGRVLPAGEEGLIEVLGPQVTPGYHNNQAENKKSFTPDGYFKTGDLGKLTIHGELVITGRAKDIIVLASGENIDPTRIEDAISRFPFIKDAVLVGQDKKGLGALLVPNMEELRSYLAEKFDYLTKDRAGDEDLLQDKKVLSAVKGEMNRLLKPKDGFRPYEKLQEIVFLSRDFKFGEELTNTLKKKRHFIENKYREIINNLLR
ncbi:MAG: long-chain fatty acid--CoA ligase [Deltaproteobacteria bacterium]|nr:MAG: long-chain fatty acid--CoA ligase [Deltaproteobacteria bacterium]